MLRDREQVRARSDARPPSPLEVALPPRPRLCRSRRDGRGRRPIATGSPGSASTSPISTSSTPTCSLPSTGSIARRDGSTSALDRIAQAAALLADRQPAARVPRHRHPERARDPSRDRRLDPLCARERRRRLLRARPRLDQSGEGSTSGAITKTGSRYARRLLVEAAWHTRARRGSPDPTTPPRGLAGRVRQIAGPAQRRLYRMHPALREHHKPANMANAARARELACFLWAAATSPWPDAQPRPDRGAGAGHRTAGTLAPLWAASCGRRPP